MKYLQHELQRIYHKVSTKHVAIFAIVFVLFTAIALPYVSALTTRVIGVAESPDTSFAFSASHIMGIVESYGIDGRLFYVLMRWTFDVVWPLIYTLFLGSSIAYFARRSGFRFGYKVLYIVLLAVFFDVFENINATIIMLLFPTEAIFFVYLLMIASLLKWIFIGISFIFVILLLLRFIVFSYRKNLEK